MTSMNRNTRFLRVTRLAVSALVAGGLGWASYAAVTWLRYGRTRPDLGEVPLVDALMPDPEVDECHSVRVHAPADVTFAAACGLDLQSSFANAAILALRTLPARLRGESVRVEASKGLLEETLALGWGRLAEDPGREIVMGAVTQPWRGEVTFRPLPAEEFRAFAEPEHAKIIWTLSVEPISEHATMFRTRTRVSTTDPVARRLFRRYWAIFSPGILIIRYEALRLIRAAAEREARRWTQTPMALPIVVGEAGGEHPEGSRCPPAEPDEALAVFVGPHPRRAP
jgi:hypothetical protein